MNKRRKMAKKGKTRKDKDDCMHGFGIVKGPVPVLAAPRAARLMLSDDVDKQAWQSTCRRTRRPKPSTAQHRGFIKTRVKKSKNNHSRRALWHLCVLEGGLCGLCGRAKTAARDGAGREIEWESKIGTRGGGGQWEGQGGRTQKQRWNERDEESKPPKTGSCRLPLAPRAPI